MSKKRFLGVWFQTWSCWASWFSSPSTIEANLSLLFLSAAIVMAARILSRLEENRRQGAGHNTKVNKHFYHLTDRTFTHNFQLKHHVSYLPVCAGVDICSASLWRPWQMLPLSISLYAIWPIIAVVSNFDLIVLVTKVMGDKKQGFYCKCVL